jgi:hypothetical protein
MPKKLTTGERIAKKFYNDVKWVDATESRLAALIDAAVRKAAWEGFTTGAMYGHCTTAEKDLVATEIYERFKAKHGFPATRKKP